jgi:predicted amino acid dehydrogenase
MSPGVRSKTGEETEGDLIYVPYLPQQIMSLPSQVVLDRVIEAGRVAKKARFPDPRDWAPMPRLSAGSGVQIQEALDMPVTTGSAYTVGSAIRASSWVAEEIFGHREMIVAD